VKYQSVQKQKDRIQNNLMMNNSEQALPRSAGFTTKIGAKSSSASLDTSTSSSNNNNPATTTANTTSWGERLLQRAQQRRMSRHRQAVEDASSSSNTTNNRSSSVNSNRDASSASGNRNNQQQQQPPTNNGSLFARSLGGSGNVGGRNSRISSLTGGMRRPLSGSRRLSGTTTTTTTTTASSYFPNTKTKNNNIENTEDSTTINSGLFENDDEDGDDDNSNDDYEIEAKFASKKMASGNNSNSNNNSLNSSLNRSNSNGVPRPPNRPASSTVLPTTTSTTTSTLNQTNNNNTDQKRPASAATTGTRTSLPTKRPSSAYVNAHNQNTATENVSAPYSTSTTTTATSTATTNSASNSGNNNKTTSSSASAKPASSSFNQRPASATTTSSSNNNTNKSSSGSTNGLTPEAQSLREQGNVQFQAKKYAEAVETYSRALSYAPRSETLLCNRAAANLMLHRFGDALRDSQRAADIDSSLTKAHWRAAKSALFLGQSDTAKQHYTIAQRQALSQSDADAIATELKMVDVADRCRRALRAKDWGEALRAADSLLQVFPVSSPCASVWLCLKIEALLPSDANEALAVAVNTTETDALSADAWIARAKCTFYTGHDAASTSASLGFLSKAKDLDQACGHRAITLQAAIEIFAKLRDDGNSAYTAGRWLDAHNAYSKCLTIDPNNVSLRAIILCNRAAVAIQRNMWTEALEDIDQSIRLNPTNAKAFTRRARIHQHFNKLDAAIRDLQTAVTIFPSPENQERLAQALEQRTNQNEQNNNNNDNNNHHQQNQRTSSRAGFTSSRPGSAAAPRPGSAAGGGTNGRSSRPQSSAGFRFFAFGGTGNGGNGARPSSAAGFRGGAGNSTNNNNNNFSGGGFGSSSRPQSAGGAGRSGGSSSYQQQQHQTPQQPCLYGILGVARGCDDKAIVKAYREGALKFHPDKWNTASEAEKKIAEAKFKDIANAYNILKDATRRRQYDVSGSY